MVAQEAAVVENMKLNSSRHSIEKEAALEKMMDPQQRHTKQVNPQTSAADRSEGQILNHFSVLSYYRVDPNCI